MMEPEQLLTYCGGYCGCCARSLRHKAFRKAAALLAEIVDSHGYQYWMPVEIKEFDYAEFRKGLDFFRREDTWLVCREGCKGGGGGPPDCVRECCKEHGVDVCFECREFPCDKVKGKTEMMERAKEYKRLGREEWLRHQDEKAKKGFEGHTGKYYEVLIEEH